MEEMHRMNEVRAGVGWGGEHGASSSSPAPPCVDQTGSSLNPVLQGFYEGFIT